MNDDKYLLVGGELVRRPNYVKKKTRWKLKKYILKHDMKRNGVFLEYKGKNYYVDLKSEIYTTYIPSRDDIKRICFGKKYVKRWEKFMKGEIKSENK